MQNKLLYLFITVFLYFDGIVVVFVHVSQDGFIAWKIRELLIYLINTLYLKEPGQELQNTHIAPFLYAKIEVINSLGFSHVLFNVCLNDW